MNRKYIFHKNPDDAVNLQNCGCLLEDNSLTLSWEWPPEQSIRLALVFCCQEEYTDIETLINSNHHHDVIVRDLAAQYEAIISEEKYKFILCPARFEDTDVAVYAPSYISEWIYRKATVSASVSYTSIPLGQYKKATITITPWDTDLQAISYSIKEYGRTIATYSLDSTIIAGGHLYIKKSQYIEFNLHPDYAHLIELED